MTGLLEGFAVHRAGSTDPAHPLLVLVHGLGGAATAWSLVVPHLAADHRLLLLDLPGHGQAPPVPPASMTPRSLGNRLRRFVFPMTAVFLLWYATYVALGAFAHDFMATKVWGNINVGLIIGLGQFASTFLITALYVRFANRELDPRAAALRTELGGQAR